MANLYETLLIVAPEADEERINAVVGDLRSTVEADGGDVLHSEVWGRRKLAYKVKRKNEGIFVLMHTEGSADLPAAMKARLRLDESVIRHMVVRLEDQAEAAARKQAEEHAAEEVRAAQEQKAAAERRAQAAAEAALMSAAEAEEAAEEATRLEGAEGLEKEDRAGEAESPEEPADEAGAEPIAEPGVVADAGVEVGPSDAAARIPGQGAEGDDETPRGEPAGEPAEGEEER